MKENDRFRLVTNAWFVEFMEIKLAQTGTLMENPQLAAEFAPTFI